MNKRRKKREKPEWKENLWQINEGTQENIFAYLYEDNLSTLRALCRSPRELNCFI